MQTSLHRLNGLLSELKIERDFTQAFIFAPKPPNEIFGRVSKEQSTFEKETLVHFVLAPSKETVKKRLKKRRVKRSKARKEALKKA